MKLSQLMSTQINKPISSPWSRLRMMHSCTNSTASLRHIATSIQEKHLCDGFWGLESSTMLLLWKIYLRRRRPETWLQLSAGTTKQNLPSTFTASCQSEHRSWSHKETWLQNNVQGAWDIHLPLAVWETVSPNLSKQATRTCCWPHKNNWIICGRRLESSSSSRSIIFFIQGWGTWMMGRMTKWMDGWKGRPSEDKTKSII
jgi:hypothetical protein